MDDHKLASREVPNYGVGGRAFVVFCAKETQTFLTNNSMQMAAAIAFYSFFSLFPLSLLIILSVDALATVTDLRETELARVLSTFIPVNPGTLADSIKTAAGLKELTGPLALLALIWASTAVFATLRKGINTSWNVRTPRAFLKERVIDLAFTAGAGLILLTLLLATSVLRVVAESDVLDPATGLFSGPVWLTLSSFLITFVSFTILYWFLPNTKVMLRNVVFGALLAAVAFEVAKGAFFTYTQARGDVAQIYGEFTSIAALLGWLYVSAAIVLVGGLTASVYSQLTTFGIVGHRDIWSFGVWPFWGRLLRAYRHCRN